MEKTHTKTKNEAKHRPGKTEQKTEYCTNKDSGAKVLEKRIGSLLGTTNTRTIYTVAILCVIGVFLLLLNQVMFSSFLSPLMSLILNMILVVTVVAPVIILQYRHYKKMKNVEENFPNFVKAISEGVSSNMSLPQAVTYASKSNFGALTPYIDKMVSQMSWGISFEDAFRNMAHSVDNKLIIRAVSTIIEAHSYGGKISSALESIGKSVTEIEKLRRERMSMISGQMMQGYLIFFIFIVVMIGLVCFLLPVLGTDMIGGTGASNANLPAQYAAKFKHLSVIQGFFSGIVIGKLSEGTLPAGFKHAIIMSFIGYAGLTIAIYLTAA